MAFTMIDHIEVQVPNSDQFVEFLTGMGFEEIHRSADVKGIREFVIPGTPVEYQTVIEVKQKDIKEMQIAHIAFRSDDLPTDVQGLKDRGLAIDEGRERYQSSAGRWLSNFRDPFDGKWQMTESDLERR